MTTLIAWSGVDSRGPSSLYFASDSRFSWRDEGWLYGKKLFISKVYPDILAYCGGVVFPLTILNQIIENIDIGLLYDKKDDFDKKNQKVFNSIKRSFDEYPVRYREGFHIIHGCREGQGMQSVFYVFKIQYISSHWKTEKLEIPKKSILIFRAGSGSNSMKKWNNNWQGSDSKETSRSVFSAFCDSIESNDDPYSGGPPQLAGIYREGNAFNCGIIQNNRRYFNGMPIVDYGNISSVEWRNCLFERCDGETMNILPKAQRQPRPWNV